MKGFIYVRNHKCYQHQCCSDVKPCKLGRTNNIPERDSVYSTNEIERGYFDPVYEMDSSKVVIVEKMLQNEFKDYNIKVDAGQEFFDQKIKNLIENYLNLINIVYKKLDKEEIDNLIRMYRLKKILSKYAKKIIENFRSRKENNTVLYKPRDYQLDIITKSLDHYKINDKGFLVLTCGVGKTLLSLWISEKLEMDKILIAVPNKSLMAQWRKTIENLYKNTKILLIKSNITVENIKDFLNKNKKVFIITIYNSSKKVLRASDELKYIFDIKILDEVHHVTTVDIERAYNKKSFVRILSIKSIKQLSLTATLKTIEISDDDRETLNVISNNDQKYFGEIIEEKNLLWAIEQNIVCDYYIQTIVSDEDKLEDYLERFNIFEDNHKRLFLSAFCALKSIRENHSHHLLIYGNTTENITLIIEYIRKLLDFYDLKDQEIFCSEYCGLMNDKKKEKIIRNFESSKFGILSCVYCLGEGWDFPLLDGVIFAENMFSDIRILQSALRPLRKDSNNPDKRGKIILPVLYRDEWLEDDNQDLKKVKEVIRQISLEDKTIEQKIKVYTLISEDNKEINNIENNDHKEFIGQYNEEMTLKLRLKSISRFAMNISYNKAKMIIGENNVNSKNEYYLLCQKDVRLSKEPDDVYGNTFKGWIDYLSIEMKYYDLNTCKIEIGKILDNNRDLDKYYSDLVFLCHKFRENDQKFPPVDIWCDYYKIESLNEIVIFETEDIVVFQV